MKVLNVIALILVIVGGINWGLVGAINYDLVATLLGDMSVAARSVYCAVGVAGLYCLLLLGKVGK
jgi:uncharacterized membrane protein YuzA (DUF378 family)